jgi:phosphoserine phosphatase RsbU/P
MRISLFAGTWWLDCGRIGPPFRFPIARMKKFLFALLVLCCGCCGVARAQSFNMQTDHEKITSLDGLWRFHTGDDSRWADPKFDDSQWPLLRSDESWDGQGYKGYGGFAWYRFTVETAGTEKPLSLALTRIPSSYRVYADGRLIGGYGYMPPSVLALRSRPRAYDLPRAGQPGPRIIHIAIRVWQFPEWASYAPGGVLDPGNIAGDRQLIQQRMRAFEEAATSRIANTYTFSVLALLFGLVVLGLFLFRPAEREYLWFALLLLASAADAAIGVGVFLSLIPVQIFDLIDALLVAVLQIAALLFFSKVLHARKGFWWWFVCVAALLEPLTPLTYIFGWTSVPFSGAAEVLCLLPSQLWILAILAVRAWRRDANARLLLIPVFLLYGFVVGDNLAQVSYQLGWNPLTSSLDATLLHFPFALGVKEVVSTIFVFVMMLFLVRRFSLARREEERLSGELEAARSMQSLLVPVKAPATTGFAVESVYIPATEVGGDFFQILPGEDGSLLIVVGDVSGKGLKAAMTVSTIVGALRNEKDRRPAEVLRNLNRVLYGQVTGFATCLAAHLSADGLLTMANAGHLPPYRNGDALAIPGSLPMGIAAGIEYETVTLHLSPSDRLTFMSDGVVEAQTTSGELFGFARTGELSREPAEAIARAAQQFGQQDDITVVTMEFLGVPSEALA